MRTRSARGLLVLVAVAAAASIVLSYGAQQSGTRAQWTGDWDKSNGCYWGPIVVVFEGQPDGGSRDWTDAEKRVVLAAVSEWERILQELAKEGLYAACGKGATPGLSESGSWSSEAVRISFRWARGADRDGTRFRPGVAARMTGAVGGTRPTGVDFHDEAASGFYVDATPNEDGDDVWLPGHWDLLSVALHEIGHILGLKHPDTAELAKKETGSVMDTWLTGQRQRTTQFDKEALRALYKKCPCPVPEVPQPARPQTPAPGTHEVPKEKEEPPPPPRIPGFG